MLSEFFLVFNVSTTTMPLVPDLKIKNKIKQKGKFCKLLHAPKI